MLPDPRADLALLSIAAPAERLASRARSAVLRAVSEGGSLQGWALASRALDDFSADLAGLLGETMLASALAGMARVGEGLEAGSSGPAASAPPAPSPEAVETARRGLASLPAELRQRYLESMPPELAEQLEDLAPPLEDLLAPLGVQPKRQLPLVEEAVSVLRNKDLLSYRDLAGLAQEARRKALAVSEGVKADVLERVRGALAEAVARGPDLREWRAAVKDELSSFDAETVFRDAVQGAYSEGMDRLLQHPLVGEQFPYEETLPIRDSRLSSMCSIVSRSGIQETAIFRRDDPVWQRLKPPRHPRCLLPKTLVEGRFVAGLEARYSGEVVQIATRGGKNLTVTANHPVLARTGFVLARDLREGDNLLSHNPRVEERPDLYGVLVSQPFVRRLSVPGEDEQHPPARAQHLFSALVHLVGGVIWRTPTRPDDLHGDAAFGQGYVQIACPVWELLGDVQVPFSNRRDDLGLEGMDAGLILKPRPGTLHQFGKWLLAPAGGPPGVAALTLDGGRVEFELRPFQGLRLGSASDLHSRGEETIIQSPATDSGPVADRLQRLAPDVSLDEIVEVRNGTYSGHVYDFESRDGWIVANGLFVSNCRCGRNPLSVEEAAHRGIREAKEWERTGRQPWPPAHVAWPEGVEVA